jgi:SAM-dependent methyltransferase
MFQSFQYPQLDFSNAILHVLKNEDALLLDVPCGDGATTFLLARHSRLSVKGYDLSEKSISFASGHFRRRNLSYAAADIRDVFFIHPQFKYFCMINSLFMLPSQAFILQKIYEGLLRGGKTFFIIPNIHGKNYVEFKKIHPEVNNMEMTVDECTEYIESFCFTSCDKTTLIYSNIYGRKELRYFSVFAPFYLRLLSKWMSILQIGSPSYFLLSFNKKETVM